MDQCQSRLGSFFTHFVSLSVGDDEEQTKGIEKLQNMLENVEGIGKKKNLKKLHVTLMTLNASQEEMEMMDTAFRRAGDRFTEITGEGAFLIGFEGLEVGDGEQPPVFTKVELGGEILNIMRGVLEDELHCHLTDARFMPHATIFGGCTLRFKLKKGALQNC